MIQARSFNFYGILLNGYDPIPDDIKAYFKSMGTQLYQINGYIVLDGPMYLSGSDIRKKLPQYFSRYDLVDEVSAPTYSGWWSWFGFKTHLFNIGSSVSKTTGTIKSWTHNPLGDDYEIKQAVKDVFVANLSRNVFGDKFIHKTKFDHIGVAVLTRLPENDNPKENAHTFNKLSNFLDNNYNRENYLDHEQRNNLMNYLIIGLLSNVRTLNVEDMACVEQKSTKNKQQSITLKSIFHLNGTNEDRKHKSKISFESLLPKLYTEFKSIYDIILSDSVGWNNKKYTNHNLDKSFVDRCKLEFSSGITQEDFESSVDEIITVISRDNYVLLDMIKEQIISDLTKKNSKFSDKKILNVVIKEIDAIVSDIKKNIDVYLQFKDSRSNQKDNHQTSFPSMRFP